MLAVPAGQPSLLWITLPSPSLASMRICAADASAQLLTSSPASIIRDAPPAPLTEVLKSLMAKSVGAQAAWPATGSSSKEATRSVVFMGRVHRYGEAKGTGRCDNTGRHPGNRQERRNL